MGIVEVTQDTEGYRCAKNGMDGAYISRRHARHSFSEAIAGECLCQQMKASGERTAQHAPLHLALQSNPEHQK